MINWLTDYLGTGAYLETAGNTGDFAIVDVRDLVDRDGNTDEAILAKIREALRLLKEKSKVVVCCDFGMSRSNSIAAGVISQHEAIPFSQAVNIVQGKVAEIGVKLEVLDSVFRALYAGRKKEMRTRQRILVTGGSGFIGGRLATQLSTSYFVRSLSSKELDLTRNPVLLDLLIKENDISTLVHLANPRIYTVNIAMGDSLVMLKNVLEACRLNTVRLIYVSSWEVYSGYRSGDLVADESLPVFPKGAYGESKWMSEELIRHYALLHGLEYVILRSSPIYGENSDKPKFMYNFIDKAKRNETITTHRYINGDPRLDLLYIGDFLSALDGAIRTEGTHTFNIGSGKLTSTPEMAEMIIAVLGSRSNITSNQIDNYYSNVRMDFTKAERSMGWRPSLTIEMFLNKLLK